MGYEFDNSKIFLINFYIKTFQFGNLMYKHFYKSVFLILFFVSGGVFASEIDNTVITRTMMSSEHGLKFYIQVEGTPIRASGHCHANGTWDYVLATDNEFGKQLLSQLLAAHLSGKKVKLYGDDTCNAFRNLEDLTRLEIIR